MTTPDPYAVACPECHAVFSCEFFMQNHQMSHWPQPHAFIDLALSQVAARSDRQKVDRQRYEFVGTWDEDGKHGYEWRWLVPETSSTCAYYEVCVIDADAFWEGRNSFGYYMDTAP